MIYSKTGTFPCHKALNVIQALKEAPEDYLVYAMYADSIYPITGVTDMAINDAVSFSSVETYGKLPQTIYTVAGLLHMISQLFAESENLDPYIDACLEAAQDTDPELDLQMTCPCEISGWGIDDTCCHFYLIAGTEWEWTS